MFGYNLYAGSKVWALVKAHRKSYNTCALLVSKLFQTTLITIVQGIIFIFSKWFSYSTRRFVIYTKYLKTDSNVIVLQEYEQCAIWPQLIRSQSSNDRRSFLNRICSKITLHGIYQILQLASFSLIFCPIA